MDKQYLLTYQNREGKTDFVWFDTEEELFEFTDTDEVLNIMNAIFIHDADNLMGK